MAVTRVATRPGRRSFVSTLVVAGEATEWKHTSSIGEVPGDRIAELINRLRLDSEWHSASADLQTECGLVAVGGELAVTAELESNTVADLASIGSSLCVTMTGKNRLLDAARLGLELVSAESERDQEIIGASPPLRVSAKLVSDHLSTSELCDITGSIWDADPIFLTEHARLRFQGERIGIWRLTADDSAVSISDQINEIIRTLTSRATELRSLVDRGSQLTVKVPIRGTGWFDTIRFSRSHLKALALLAARLEVEAHSDQAWRTLLETGEL